MNRGVKWALTFGHKYLGTSLGYTPMNRGLKWVGPAQPGPKRSDYINGSA